MAKIEGLVKEVVILRDSKDILIEISESLSSLLVENKEVLISGHSINIKDVSKNRFKVNLTTEMLSSTYLDEIIYGSKILCLKNYRILLGMTYNCHGQCFANLQIVSKYITTMIKICRNQIQEVILWD